MFACAIFIIKLGLMEHSSIITWHISNLNMSL